MISCATSLEWGERAAAYVEGMDFDQFAVDLKTIDAVTRCVEVCGEAANHAGRIEPSIPARHPAFDIRSAYAMRNVLVHGYYNIVIRVLWATVTESLPQFVEVARRILRERE
jgi:uncharacterized protein with HEPN domain